MEDPTAEEKAIRETIARWRDTADGEAYGAEVLLGPVLFECADEIEEALRVRS